MKDNAARARPLDGLRDHLVTHPDLILDDPEIMSALIAANARVHGENIVDLRGVALKRLEARLDHLENTHRSVIAAAYENLAGTNIIQRAILQVLEPNDFAGFLRALESDVAPVLRVDSLRLLLESHESGADPALAPMTDLLGVVPPGFIQEALSAGRKVPVRRVVLRQCRPDSVMLHGARARDIRSEALLRLDLGGARLPGLLVLGAEDPHQFRPTQGTDLLGHFASVFERAMRRWLG